MRENVSLKRILPCVSVALVLSIWVPAQKTSSLNDAITSRHSLSEIAADKWVELEPSAGSLLGHSFRVFANQSAVDWIRNKKENLDGVEFIKLVLTSPDEIDEKIWSAAKIESVRSIRASDGQRVWAFYGFGPMHNPASEAIQRPQPNCLGCHARANFRGEPLFLGFYLNQPKMGSEVQIRIISESLSRRLVIEPLTQTEPSQEKQ